MSLRCVRDLLNETFFANKKNSRWSKVNSLTIEAVLDGDSKLLDCFPLDDAEAPTQLTTFVFKMSANVQPRLDCFSIENLVLWVKELPNLQTLAFHVSNCQFFVVEKLITEVIGDISTFGLPDSIRNFHLSSGAYLGSFKCLEPLIHFVLQSAGSKLRELEIDLNLGVAVENTEKLMQAFQHLLDVNRTIVRLQIPKLANIKNLKTIP